MKAKSRRAFALRRAFTLMELLIVLLILTIISGTVYDQATRIGQQGDMQEARANVQAASARTLDCWRRDALLAEQVECAPDGAAMTLTLRDERNKTFTVVYELSDSQLVRRSSSPHEPALLTLCPTATDLIFESHGRHWSISWRHGFYDGRQEWNWPQQGYAAPLF